MKIITLIMCTSIALSSFAAKNAELVKVEMKKAKLTTIEKSLLYPIQIQSKVESDIKSDGNFIVVKKNITLGQKVKKGDLLLTLRNQDTSVHYEKRQIKASVDGVVASISIKEGQFVKTGDSLLYINDPDNLYGTIEISPLDYNKLQVGLTGLLTIGEMDIKGLDLTVAGIASKVDPLTGTLKVELDIGKNEKLIPGVIGKAEITLNKRELLLVKEKSLYYVGDKTFVVTLNDKKIVKKPVKLGKRYKDKIEILEGLRIEEGYITDSPSFLREGQEVALKEKAKKKN